MENDAPQLCPHPNATCTGLDCVWFDYDDGLCAFLNIRES